MDNLIKIRLFISCAVIILNSGCSIPNNTDLAGTWNYRLDENEIGEQQQWFLQKFTQNTINLPAALRDHDIGNVPTLSTQWTGSIFDSSWYFRPEFKKYRQEGNLKFPFWLTPEKRFVGKSWFQKEISIPDKWERKNLSLFLERPHWQTMAWFDSSYIGKQNSLSIPHKYLIPASITSPGKHTITICVDNAVREIDPGVNSHSITDHTQGNWNGITGRIELTALNNINITRVKITPVLRLQQAQIEIYVTGFGESQQVDITLSAKGINHKHSISPVTKTYSIADGRVAAVLEMGEHFQTWSEFAPNLYKMNISLKNPDGQSVQRTETFGMREFKVKGQHFVINDIPIFLRGTTDCCVFPLTGYPPTDEPSWIRIFEKCKSFGLNHMRFHSWCPPEAAFSAADKAGIYLQVEGPSWAKYSVTLGDGKPIDQYLMEETKNIIDTYGNHPSFVMMAYGNEPSGNYVPYLENWVDQFRQYDSQRLFTGASTGRSWEIIHNSDFIVRSPPRGLAWNNKQPNSLFDYSDKTENLKQPYISFEMGQWCVFPNFNEIDKYNGPLKARNFELFQEDLKDHHMLDQADSFLIASGKLQVSCYKQEIEAALRTPNLAGFQLLSLNDFSGQGTALVGVLDAFWDEKGYITANEFAQFCNAVVPLVRLPKFVFLNNENVTGDVEVANFSGEVLAAITPKWSLLDKDNTIITTGVFATTDIPMGLTAGIGSIDIPLVGFKSAQKCVLQVQTGKYTNSWNIWIYPHKLPAIDSKGIYIAKNLDKHVRKALDDGAKVLLLASGKVENGKDIVQYYQPAFWNTSWFRMRPPHTTGVLINKNHPLFKRFPTDFYSDLQWWDLVNKQQVINLENFPEKFRPIVQPIDTWFLNRRLAMIFEARVGSGRLVVCSIDLIGEESHKPVAIQLYNSILSYMNSESFKPGEKIDIDVVEELFIKKDRKKWNSYVKVNP
jgi:hypothetical protein